MQPLQYMLECWCELRMQKLTLHAGQLPAKGTIAACQGGSRALHGSVHEGTHAPAADASRDCEAPCGTEPTCKVHKVEACMQYVGDAISVGGLAFHAAGEDRMRPAGLSVHGCLSHPPLRCSLCKQLHCLLDCMQKSVLSCLGRRPQELDNSDSTASCQSTPCCASTHCVCAAIWHMSEFNGCFHSLLDQCARGAYHLSLLLA